MRATVKRLFAFLCCCALCVGLIPVQAFAPTQAFAEESTTVRALEMGSDAVWQGDMVYFGEGLRGYVKQGQGAWSVVSKTGNSGTYKDGDGGAVGEDSAMLLLPIHVLWYYAEDPDDGVFQIDFGGFNYKESRL